MRSCTGWMLCLLIVLGAGPAMAQGQGTGLEARVSNLETQVAQQARQLETVVAQLATLANRATAVEHRAAALEAWTQPVFNVTADCGNGDSIGAALARTGAHGGVVVVTVLGSCRESLSVTLPQTLIRGGEPGAEIVASNAASPVVQVFMPAPGIGAARVLGLSGLTIRGGSFGIIADSGSHLQLDRVTLRDNGTAVSIDRQALLRVQNSLLQGNTVGIAARNGSQVLVTGTTIRDGLNYALQLDNGSVGQVTGNSLITQNQSGGFGTIRGAVGLYAGSMLRLDHATISNNSGNGIFAVAGSSVWLENGVVIDANGGAGISLWDTGVIGKMFVTTDIRITNNGSWGITCAAAPGAAQLYGFPTATPSPGGPQPITVTGNGSGAISCAVSAGSPW